MSFIERMCVAVEVVDDIVDLTHYSVSGLGCMVSLSSRREGPATWGYGRDFVVDTVDVGWLIFFAQFLSKKT